MHVWWYWNAGSVGKIAEGNKKRQKQEAANTPIQSHILELDIS
jgi:hypothetical protein